MYICNFLKCFVCQGRKLSWRWSWSWCMSARWGYKKWLSYFYSFCFLPWRKRIWWSLFFKQFFFNITIPISAIQGDLNDIYAERITSNYQEVANGLSKLNSLAGWKDVWRPAFVSYKRISYELNGFAMTFKVQKKSIRLYKLLIFSDFLGKLGDGERFKCYHFFFIIRLIQGLTMLIKVSLWKEVLWSVPEVILRIFSHVLKY